MPREQTTPDLLPSAVTVLPRAAWSGPTRVAFRFVFVYLLQFALAADHLSLLGNVPVIGVKLQAAAAFPYVRLSQVVAVRWFHLSGPAAVPHATAFDDRALDWITEGLMLAIALVAAALWSFFARHRAYPVLWVWFRFVLRLTLVAAMFWYGAIKLWPVQMESPSLAVLNEPVGQLSPMTLLWTLLGSSHGYEVTCGLCETMCGLLLLLRRTALAGALLAIVILSNVFLFDIFYDVPVRLYATHLLLTSIVITAPDLCALYELFWEHRPAILTSRWTPPITSVSAWRVVLGTEMLFFLVFLRPFWDHGQYTHEHVSEQHPAALSGQWHLESSLLHGDVQQPALFRTPMGAPLADVFLERNGRTTVRAIDGTLYGGATYSADRVELPGYLLSPVAFHAVQPDADRLLLIPDAPGMPNLSLSRVNLPQSYPLLQGHWTLANEFGYEH